MDKIAIYGLGGNFRKYKELFTSERCMGGEIVAYSDREQKNIEKFVNPKELLAMDLDVIVVTCEKYEEVKNELNDERTNYFVDYFFEKWNVDRRAVKFLDPTFVDNLILVKNLLGNVKNFVEIGANFAQDAVLAQRVFGLDDKNVYIFEPHPQIMKTIKQKYEYNFYEKAASDSSGKALFNMCDIDLIINNGMSSLKDSKELYDNRYSKVEVDVVRMEEMIDLNILPGELDFVKIDVEGATYEVLKGFGNKLRSIKMIQCEGDYHPYWEGEILFDRIFELLWQNGFRMISFQITDDYKETESLWLRIDKI